MPRRPAPAGGFEGAEQGLPPPGGPARGQQAQNANAAASSAIARSVHQMRVPLGASPAPARSPRSSTSVSELVGGKGTSPSRAAILSSGSPRLSALSNVTTIMPPGASTRRSSPAPRCSRARSRWSSVEVETTASKLASGNGSVATSARASCADSPRAFAALLCGGHHPRRDVDPAHRARAAREGEQQLVAGHALLPKVGLEHGADRAASGSQRSSRSRWARRLAAAISGSR